MVQPEGFWHPEEVHTKNGTVLSFVYTNYYLRERRVLKIDL